MKSTFIFQNKGDRPNAEIFVQFSYFVLFDGAVAPSTREFSFLLQAQQATTAEVDFGDSAVSDQDLLVVVQRPKGNIITQKDFRLSAVDNQTENIELFINKEIDPNAVPAPVAEERRPSLVYARLLDKKGEHRMDDVQVIILGKVDSESEFEPITAVQTEAQGYFFFEYPEGTFQEAAALVGMELKQNPVPIKLTSYQHAGSNVSEEAIENGAFVFPNRLVVVVELLDDSPMEGDTSADGCSANDFEDKRVLEEYSFFTLVRTSQPSIKGYILEDEDEINLADVLGNLPFSVFEVIEPIKLLPYFTQAPPIPGRLLGTRISSTRIRAVRAESSVSNETFLQALRGVKIKRSVLNDFLRTEKALTKDNVTTLLAQNETAQLQQVLNKKPEVQKPLGRVILDADNSVDWDDEPTIYQAVEIAHGHLLQYKTEWLADGYSLGDLLYSLPLAPGQKKQIVVFDWERRESASNTQSTDFEESLYNSLSRDRDVLEIAKGVLEENVRGRSTASTGGGGFGLGGMIGGFLLGVGGGFGTASSKASQDSFRQVSSSDQQKLRDKIRQSSNVVRSLRSTVIQTVSQGERFEVSAESVANYNHCHALTIQYYEVLRHFKIRQRFASAREVLFVPLLMSVFDLKKALRWREAILRNLLDKRLAAGFDAGDRVSHEWQDSNFPSGTYASEAIINATGVLKVKFVLQRPADKIVEVDDEDRPIVSNGIIVGYHKKREARIIVENWTKLTGFLGSFTPETFYDTYLLRAADKDAVFHRELGERIARGFVDSLVFRVNNESGQNIGTLPIDPSITSRYYRNGILNVNLRLTNPTAFARERFHYLQILSSGSGDVLPDGSYMTVQSASMRYATKHYRASLFNYPNFGDDLTATDGVTIYAGPTMEELKDPRKEDLVIVNKMIAHLNDNLEYYHQKIWLHMTPERRFMLLDGVSLDLSGEVKSVASIVENELLGIVGNSLVFPVAPGLNINPDFGMKESLTEFYMTAGVDPISVSVPTKGVFAEAVLGKCNSCEEIDETRFWRWEESPLPDSPTSINPVSTDSRRSDLFSLQAQPLPNPIVNIQNAPEAPAPAGLSAALGLLGQANLFKDITGLEGNQKNAIQAFQTSMETAKAFGQEAAKLETQKTMERRLDKAMNAIDKSKGLSEEQKNKLKGKAISAYIGGGATNEEDSNNVKFEEGVKMVDQLEKSGLLSAEAAKDAKDKLIKTYLDNSSTGKPKSIDDETKLVDAVKKNNVEYKSEKPNGEKVEIKPQNDSTGTVQIPRSSGGSANPADEPWVNLNSLNSPLKRTFFPDKWDKSGKIELEAVISDAPAYATFRWTAQTPDRVVFSQPNQSKTEVVAGRPGISSVLFELMDAQGNLLRTSSFWIGVPQFFVVRENIFVNDPQYTPEYGQTFDQLRAQDPVPNPKTFDGVLAQLNLTNQKAAIVARIKKLVENELLHTESSGDLVGHNLRVIWQVGQFQEFIHKNIVDNGFFTSIYLLGYPPTASIDWGRTVPSQGMNIGPKDTSENIAVYPGTFELSVLNATSNSTQNQNVHDVLQKLILGFRNNPTDPGLISLMIEVFSRIIANVICHEIYHSVIYHHYTGTDVDDTGFDTEGHTTTAGIPDIMTKMRDFETRTGIQVTDLANFPNPGTYTIVGDFAHINAENSARIDLFFPVPPTFPFDQ